MWIRRLGKESWVLRFSNFIFGFDFYFCGRNFWGYYLLKFGCIFELFGRGLKEDF